MTDKISQKGFEIKTKGIATGFGGGVGIASIIGAIIGEPILAEKMVAFLGPSITSVISYFSAYIEYKAINHYLRMEEEEKQRRFQKDLEQLIKLINSYIDDPKTPKSEKAKFKRLLSELKIQVITKKIDEIVNPPNEPKTEQTLLKLLNTST